MKMKKYHLFWALIAVSLFFPHCKYDSSDELQFISGCGDLQQDCQRSYYSEIVTKWRGAFNYQQVFISKFILNGGEAVYLSDTTCVNTVCNQFELDLKADSTFKIQFDIILPNETEQIYSDSLMGEFSICWCHRSSGGHHPGWWYGEITLHSDSTETIIPFERSLIGEPMKFNFETAKGEFNIYLQDIN